MRWEDYYWPGTEVLRNRLGIKDPAALDYTEREIVAQRVAEGAPAGDFDLAHLRAIHHHLFQDLYAWAGELRQHPMHKGGANFHPPDRLQLGMADVHARLERMDRLQGRSAGDFAAGAGEIIGDINHLHPFREGNGRTQLEYLRQLTDQAGHAFDARQLDPARWLQASIDASERSNFAGMTAEIGRALIDQQRVRQEEIDAPLRASRDRTDRDRDR